jgi:hypothetical protein
MLRADMSQIFQGMQQLWSGDALHMVCKGKQNIRQKQINLQHGLEVTVTAPLATPLHAWTAQRHQELCSGFQQVCDPEIGL